MDNITIINGSLQFICQNVSQSEGFESPTSREVFIDPPEREGSLFINELAGRRDFSWRGLISSDIQENRRLLSRVCSPGGLKTIKFSTCDNVALQTEAILKLVSVYRKSRCVYMITAKAPYPYFLSQTLHSDSTGVTLRRGGLPIPAAIRAPLSTGSGSAFSVVNAGNISARPKFTIHGPGSTFIIKNLDTEEQIQLNLELDDDEEVTIDTITNEVLMNGDSVFGSIDRDPVGSWITLAPGSNDIAFSAISGSTMETELTIEWRDAYSGV